MKLSFKNTCTLHSLCFKLQYEFLRKPHCQTHSCWIIKLNVREVLFSNHHTLQVSFPFNIYETDGGKRLEKNANATNESTLKLVERSSKVQ